MENDKSKVPQFLALVRDVGFRFSVPSVWNAEFRAAMSDNLVQVGFSGKLELTEGGRNLLKSQT